MSFIGRPNPEFAPAYAKYYFDRTIGQDDLILALEKDLEENRRLLQQALDAASMGIIELDTATSAMTTSPSRRTQP